MGGMLHKPSVESSRAARNGDPAADLHVYGAGALDKMSFANSFVKGVQDGSSRCQVPPPDLLDRFVDKDELLAGTTRAEVMEEDK
eukprot:37897-Chlamydomonas_euryale.AAC.11